MKLARIGKVRTENLVTTCEESLPAIVRGKRLSCIAAMSARGMEDVDIYEGNINGAIFTTFVA